MSVPLSTSSSSSRSPHIVTGLFGLIVFLICALAIVVLVTAYLLRTATTPRVAMPEPAAYRVLYQQGAQIWSLASNGAAHPVMSVPLAVTGLLPAVNVAPDGRHVLLVGADDHGVERAWLLDQPGATPHELPLPPSTIGFGPWHIQSTVWQGSTGLALLLIGPSGTGGVVERYADGNVSWDRLRSNLGHTFSLAPTTDEVALVVARPAAGVFDGQVTVRLRAVRAAHGSYALRYLGTQAPTALFWSPDGGTLAFLIPGQGLAIQKSSGRTVRLVPDGMAPLAFTSNVAADLAYLAGSPGAWQIHVLNLHGELDTAFPAPDGNVPRWLGWTPDARVLLYASSNTLWQINPASGMATRLSVNLDGNPLGAVPAGAPFAP